MSWVGSSGSTNRSYNVTSVEIEGIVAPTSTACWFWDVGYSATTWTVTIPSTNGGGINNTTSRMYGNTTSIYATHFLGNHLL